MVFKYECTKMIFDTFPEFKNSKTWKEDLEFWGGDKPGPCDQMSTFGEFVTEEVLNAEKPSVNSQKVFDFIEMLMQNGDQDVIDIAATCFLENLINYTSWGNLEAAKFVHLLGKKSKEFCKGWDEFTGVKTPGLWDDDV